jgi:hypothetical protein
MVKLVRMSHYFEDEGAKNRIENLPRIAKEEGWKIFFQSTPVCQELNAYLEAILKAMPKLKFAPYEYTHVNESVFDESGTYQTTKSFRIARSFLLYMDEYPFELGRASYGDHSVSGDGDPTYAVYSRRINNAKYATHRDQHFMIMASDMSKAVKNIRKYVTRYTTKELARALFEPFYNNVGRSLQKAQGNVGDAIKTVKYNDVALVTELRHLIKSGVQFVTPEFIELANKLPALTEELVTQKQRKPDGVFVAFKSVGDEMYVEMCVAHNARGSYLPTLSEDVATCKVAELPPEIAGNIAVLNILENDNYVDGVGVKIDATHFWLERG